MQRMPSYFSLFLALVGLTGWAAAADRPNIILMMADDMGYSDIGCYGGEIQTPALDALAAGGVRFTQFYNTGRCCPTRAALLTGLYPHQAGIGHMMNDRGLEGYQGDLNNQCVTIAQVMKTAGYATYMSGKWHVTKYVNPKNVDEKRNWPRQRGFDRFFGTIHGAGSFYDPNSLTRDNTLIAPDTDDFYYTHAIGDNAASFIKEHDTAKPFFMYVAFTAPHWPMHALETDIAKYTGRYDSGWDTLRAERYQRMIELGLIDASWPLSPRDPKSPDWVESEHKHWNARCMEVYAAMVDSMDQNVAKIVNSLKTTGQFENTVMMFLADNGGCAEENGRNPKLVHTDKNPDQVKPMQPGELQYNMIPKRTRDGRPLRRGVGVMPGPADTYLGYGRSWANASNTPFREYKHWVHEGGISSPLIVHWPRGIKANRLGKFERQPGHLIDLMATCVDLADASYPATYAGHRITPMQGVSLRPAFGGDRLTREQPIFWEHEGNRAMRDGSWKLVAKGARGGWELYNIKQDRTELNDLSQAEASRKQQMIQTWEAWAIAAKVKPWPWNQPKKAKSR